MHRQVEPAGRPRRRARACSRPRRRSRRSRAARPRRRRRGRSRRRAGSRPPILAAAVRIASAGPRVGVEVDVLQAVGREVGVELRGGDVGVAEHLLQRAQVAAARRAGAWRTCGGACAGSSSSARPGGARVALDDLVEALAGQPGAAVVDEQARLEPVADEPRAAALEVGRRARGRRPSRPGRGAPWSPCRGRAGSPASRSTSPTSRPDRLRGAQPAGVHELQQRAVAQRRRLGRRWAARAAGRPRRARAPAAAGGSGAARAGARSGRPRAASCAAQVAVEGAQAGDLALQRGRLRPAGGRRRPAASAATKSARSRVRDARGRRARSAPGGAPNCSRSER